MSGNDSRYWDAVAVEWRRGGQVLWRRHCDAVNTTLFARWLPPGTAKRVLKTDLFDEAFGEGLYPLLSARAAQVVGVDIAASVVDSARERHPGLIAAAADVRRMPFPDGWFDAVISNSTLDHFDAEEDVMRALEELARVLAPGGRLLLTMDNPANPLIWLRNTLALKLLTRVGVVPYHVGVTHGRRVLESELGRLGLAVSDATAIMHCPRALAVPLADRVDARMRARTRDWEGDRLLRLLGAFERLQHWPTRFRTGYFVAVLAHKPESAG